MTIAVLAGRPGCKAKSQGLVSNWSCFSRLSAADNQSEDGRQPAQDNSETREALAQIVGHQELPMTTRTSLSF